MRASNQKPKEIRSLVSTNLTTPERAYLNHICDIDSVFSVQRRSENWAAQEVPQT